MAMPSQAQVKPSSEEFDLLVKSGEPIYIDGERIYRPSELQRKVIILYKPEPSYTEKATKNRVEGIVEIRLILSAAGKLKVLHVRKGLPDGLTEQALKAAKKIKFRPGAVDGKPVSTFILAQYYFTL
jgi:TonB family protein